MEITEIRIKLMNDPNDRLQAFCSITFDGCFVIRDLKIIQGTRGSFVAMPSRKLTDRCPRCSAKNHLRSRFCSECGTRLHEERAEKGDDGRARLYADIAHPINSDCREMIQHRVIDAYGEELERSRLPGYICTYDDYGEDNYARLGEDIDENCAEPLILSVGDAIRRRDVAASAQQAPHHMASKVAEGEVKAHAAWRSGGGTATDEDNFGVGIV